MSQTNYTVYLHIGYPKAASTTLQSSLFYKNPNINDFSPYKAWKQGNINILRLFKLLNEGGEKEEILHLFQEHIVPNLSKTKPNIFSSESWIQNDNISLKIEQLKLLFISYSPKIIVITRNQYDLLKSLYYFLGGSLNKVEFQSLSSWLEFQIEFDQRWLETVNFYQSLQCYINWVDSSNIGVFLFENMVQDPNQFTKNLSDFLNIDQQSIKEVLEQKEKTNSSYGGRLRVIKKKIPVLGRLSLRSVLPKPIYDGIQANFRQIEKNIPIEDFTQKHKELIQAKYSQSNLELAKTFSIEKEQFQKYNYPIN